MLIVQVVLVGGLLFAASRSADFLPFLTGTSDPAHAVSAVPGAITDRFDAPAAMALTREQLAVGPRPAGSPQLRGLADQLRAQLPAGRFEPVRNGLRNIVGTIPGRLPAIVIGAHYDTAPIGGFIGANDGAAGTAAVVQLGRDLARPGALPTDHREIRFVLFDAEEAAHPTHQYYDDALIGSKAYVAAHPDQTSAMVLLDYIANKGLRLPREGSSTPRLWAQVRAAAATVRVGSVFPDRKQTTIIDDHTPFLRAGVPAVDLIDWSYRFQHVPADSYDKLSVRSMDAVGETIMLLAQREAAR